MAAIKQLAILLVISCACGAVYNLVNSSKPEKHLQWVSKVYKGSDTLPAPGAKPAASGPSSPPGGAAPAAGAASGAAGGAAGGAEGGAAAGSQGAPAASAPPSGAPSTPAASASGAGASASAPAPASGGAAPEETGEFPMVEMDRVLEELGSGTLFVDARRTKDYEAGHIPGAISMSPHEPDIAEKVSRLLAGAVLEAPVVVYCSNSKECEDSKLVARQLREAGFLDLLIYTGGFPEWAARWKDEKPERIARGSEPGSWKP